MVPVVIWIAVFGVDTLHVVTRDSVWPPSVRTDTSVHTLARAFGTAPMPEQPRPRAVEYSEWYGRRLTVHRWGSYAMLPLFATEYWLGNKLLNDDVVSQSTRDTHAAVAAGIGGLFAVNTVTGLWNLWDSRSDPASRGKRLVHSALLLAADAGFLITASLADDDRERGDDRRIQHRNAALVSIGLSTAGSALMWFFKD
jgi:hypothetical protein